MSVRRDHNAECGVRSAERPARPQLSDFGAQIERIMAYAKLNAPRVKGDRYESDDDTLRLSLAFHALHGTLAVVWPDAQLSTLNSQPPVGIAIAWQMDRKRLFKREAKGLSVFNWQPTDPAGDCIYLACVMTTHPQAQARLAQYFVDKFPGWNGLATYSHRRGRLVRCGDNILHRLCPAVKSALRTPHSGLV